MLLWQIEAPFWAWALASIVLGLGFTFFSGAVEAWLVDALTATGYTGELETVFGRGQMVERRGDADRLGRRRLHRRSRPASACRSCCARRVLAVMFVVAFVLMHDIGFTPEKGGHPAGGDAQDRRGLDRVRLARARR